MSCSPLVSILLPTFNQETTICRALDSILSQECDFDYEVLVGDDASTDATVGIAEAYMERYPQIRIFKNETNLGVAANYYSLAKRARGKYLADCAGDDAWCDNSKIKLQARLLEENPNVSVVHTDWSYYYPDTGIVKPSNLNGELTQYRQAFSSGESMFLPLLSHATVPIIHSCTMMYRRDSLMLAMEKWPELFTAPDLACEDLQLITALAKLGDVAFIPRKTLFYSVHQRSITGNRSPMQLCNFYAGSLMLTRDIQRAHGVSESQLSSVLQKLARYVIAKAFETRDKDAMQKARKACTGLRMPFASRLKVLLSYFLSH